MSTHSPQVLSPFTTSTDRTCLEPGLCDKGNHRHETREEPPHPGQRQRAATPPSQKQEKTKSGCLWSAGAGRDSARTCSPTDPSVAIRRQTRSLTHRGHRGCAPACPAARAHVPLLPPAPSRSCPPDSHVDGAWGSYITSTRGRPRGP